MEGTVNITVSDFEGLRRFEKELVSLSITETVLGYIIKNDRYYYTEKYPEKVLYSKDETIKDLINKNNNLNNELVRLSNENIWLIENTKLKSGATPKEIRDAINFKECDCNKKSYSIIERLSFLFTGKLS